MWEAFFGFKKTPFPDNPDSKQLFASQAWNQLKTRLQFLVDYHGAGLLTGEVGSRGVLWTRRRKWPAAQLLAALPAERLQLGSLRCSAVRCRRPGRNQDPQAPRNRDDAGRVLVPIDLHNEAHSLVEGRKSNSRASAAPHKISSSIPSPIQKPILRVVA